MILPFRPSTFYLLMLLRRFFGNPSVYRVPVIRYSCFTDGFSLVRYTMSKQKSKRSQQALKPTLPLQQIIALSAIVLVLGVIVILVTHSGTGQATVGDPSRLSLDAMLGNPTAPVTIVEYGAYSCTSCRAWHKAGIINQILAKYPDKVR